MEDEAVLRQPRNAMNGTVLILLGTVAVFGASLGASFHFDDRSEEHTSELQSLRHLVCRFLLDPATTEIYPLSLHDALPIYAMNGTVLILLGTVAVFGASLGASFHFDD